MLRANKALCGIGRHELMAGDFFRSLSSVTFQDLASMQNPSSYLPGIILFSEKDPPTGVFIVQDGEVKLSMNSNDGKRLILRIAKKGEMLGLASVLSGRLREMTAETLYPSKIAFIGRCDFLKFLDRHPETYRSVTEEMSRNYTMVCEQLRAVGLSHSAPARLARLLLDWSVTGQTTDHETRFRFSLTHEEIGEFIGASRETVSRTLSAFRSRHLIAYHGSTLSIPDKSALEIYSRC